MRRASKAEKARLADTFAELCRISSPSWEEAACAGRIAAELRGMGLGVEEDDAGNLLARIARDGARTVLLCAHMDTVPPLAPIDPVLVDGGWENANDGILGADNKAAVAMLIELARRATVEGAPVGLELVFTVAEEIGLQGAKRFDASQLRAEFGYVFDHATPIGEIVTASPTLYRIEAEFHGKSAHAGLRPEEGHSAIVAAAHAVAAMPHGRIDPQTTTNVGYLLGGVESTNVVPERARLLAEVRSVDATRVEEVLAAVIDAFQDGAGKGQCDVDVITEKQVTGYKQRPSSPAVVAAEAALRDCGYEPRRIATGGASDANVFDAAGLPCVNVANGTEHNHEPTERVSVAALESMLDVGFALLETRGMSSNFERVASETIHAGKFVTLRHDTFRHEDGAVVERDIVVHPGAVGVVVLDGENLWFVRQPREAVGIPDLLEIPAGKLDVEGEPPLETAKRELAEEIGKQAESWEPLGSFFTSAGFTGEEIHLFLATGISDVDERPAVEEDERIDIEIRPLSELDAILADNQDSKTLIALYRLRDRLARR